VRIQPPRLAAAALATVGVLALAACGSNSSSSASTTTAAATAAAPPTTTAAAAGGKASTVTLAADPTGALKFDKKTLTAPAGTVTVVMDNPSSSGVPHGIAVEGNGVDQDGKTVQPGGKSTDTLTLKPGTYTFYCPVPGHKAAGMVGTLVVK
jgi:plastocyanin